MTVPVASVCAAGRRLGVAYLALLGQAVVGKAIADHLLDRGWWHAALTFAGAWIALYVVLVVHAWRALVALFVEIHVEIEEHDPLDQDPTDVPALAEWVERRNQ